MSPKADSLTACTSMEHLMVGIQFGGIYLNKNQFVSIAILTCAFLCISCGSDQQSENSKTNTIKDYPVMVLAYRSATLHSAYPATIEGEENIEIRPKVEGFIDRIYIDEGATVKKGQPLFKIFAPQYEQEVRTAQANISIAQANVNASEMEVNKVRPLVDKKIISEYELQSSEYTLQANKAALAQAKATLVNARTNLAYTQIVSPVNGVVGILPYRIGSLVNSSTPQPLTTVSNISNIYAFFSVNEKQLLEFSKHAKGSNAKAKLARIPPVTLVLANGIEFSEKGRIETASGQIDIETGSVRVRATFPNPGNVVRSGSSGTVRIPVIVDSAILIPQNSTYEIQGKKFVYKVDSEGKVSSEDITIMENNDGRYFVVEKGLDPGDTIVLEGVAGLRDGALIRPKEADADSIYHSDKISLR